MGGTTWLHRFTLWPTLRKRSCVVKPLPLLALQTLFFNFPTLGGTDLPLGKLPVSIQSPTLQKHTLPGAKLHAERTAGTTDRTSALWGEQAMNNREQMMENGVSGGHGVSGGAGEENKAGERGQDRRSPCLTVCQRAFPPLASVHKSISESI